MPPISNSDPTIATRPRLIDVVLSGSISSLSVRVTGQIVPNPRQFGLVRHRLRKSCALSSPMPPPPMRS
jgi:hypothetical protein